MKTFKKNSVKALVAISLLATSLTTNVSLAQSDKDDLDSFKKALENYRTSKWEEAIKAFDPLIGKKTDLVEYALYYTAQSQMKLSQWDLAEKNLHKISSLSPNVKMTIDVSNLLGQVALEKKNYKQAAHQFLTLEKRTRNTDEYPEVIYNLARAEHGLKNQSVMCKWLVKLYEKYPSFSKVSQWTEDMEANMFEGKASRCAVTAENFKIRVRYMLWAGLDQKAQNEINVMKAKLEKTDPYNAAKLQAQYYLQDGQLEKAVQILTPFYESMKRNFEFLILYGSASARAGDLQQAVGSYYAAYKLSPNSKTGKQALYQSAFLSYQFQDYDGAGRRFQEFSKAYPSSGLNQDAKWHLAWIKYLKADYDGAFKAFADLHGAKGKRKGRKFKVVTNGRVAYWMAMSLFRQGKIDQARGIFENLSKDRLLGYYAIAAQYRLKKIETMAPLKLAAVPLAPQPRLISRFMANEFLMPSIDDQTFGDDSENEDDLLLNQYSADDEKESSDASETADSQDTQETQTEVVAQAGQTKAGKNKDKIKGKEKSAETAIALSPVLMKRFERARDLMILEENEWARWELFDIEKKTSHREYLRTLMAEYNTAGVYNRSSYIAQVTFGAQRAHHGIEGVRYLWEFAYPRAYSEPVGIYSIKFVVPEELIWGIMRAESTYRKDAISPVGALGLMQVMPYTGHKVASIIGDKDFKAPQLLEPEVAIKIGSKYLRRLMDQFENTIPLVAAGYNAGPHRVKNWLGAFGKLDTDEFIEHIPFLETRNYVKRVVSNAYVYGKLYGAKKDLFTYLAEPMPVKFKTELAGKENWEDL